MALGFSSYIFLIECTGLAQGRFPTLCVLLGRKGVVQTIPSCRDDFSNRLSGILIAIFKASTLHGSSWKGRELIARAVLSSAS